MLAQHTSPLPVAGGWPARIAHLCEQPHLVQVALQPIVDLTRGTVAGFEALARLPGPGGPEPWFVAAAELGLADAFEAVVVRRTLAARAGMPANVFLSLNLSPDALLGPAVQDVLERAGGLGGIVVEITEQAEVREYPRLIAAVARVRELGGLVAVDDMGAGHASLSHVLQLRPDFVKLDRDLVGDCDRDEARLAVLEMLGDFAGRIDAWVVAEGIERQSELDAVSRIGMPLAQGYHLGRPAADAVALRPGLGANIAAAAVRRSSDEGVGALVEPVVVVDGDDPAAIHDGWAHPDGPALLVVADRTSRPTGLLLAPGAARVGVMTTGVNDRAADLAKRAMARPAACRFDPVVICDDTGRVTGLVRLERLVGHLAGS